MMSEIFAAKKSNYSPKKYDTNTLLKIDTKNQQQQQQKSKFASQSPSSSSSKLTSDLDRIQKSATAQFNLNADEQTKTISIAENKKSTTESVASSVWSTGSLSSPHNKNALSILQTLSNHHHHKQPITVAAAAAASTSSSTLIGSTTSSSVYSSVSSTITNITAITPRPCAIRDEEETSSSNSNSSKNNHRSLSSSKNIHKKDDDDNDENQKYREMEKQFENDELLRILFKKRDFYKSKLK